MIRSKVMVILSCCFVMTYVSLANAQDMLPRDNGIFKYHEPPRWRETESHPLRVLAYVLHPVGWTLREGLFRPWSAFAGSTDFTRSFFGYREPYDYRETDCFSSSEAIPDCRKMFPSLGTSNGAKDNQPVELASNEAALSRQVFIPDVNFEFNKAELTDLGKGRVRQISQLLSSVPGLKVVVEGHADYKGTDEYNMKLGERRAQIVISELKQLGVDESRMSPISYGEAKPVFTEEENWARAVNRRVQFSVQGEVAPTMVE